MLYESQNEESCYAILSQLVNTRLIITSSVMTLKREPTSPIFRLKLRTNHFIILLEVISSCDRNCPSSLIRSVDISHVRYIMIPKVTKNKQRQGGNEEL